MRKINIGLMQRYLRRWVKECLLKRVLTQILQLSKMQSDSRRISAKIESYLGKDKIGFLTALVFTA